ncbi:MAG: isochorismatase family cysteine hydrolase [Bacillota bacterium]|nr:isochorismatase family cysteine hydrolase [Bacillota bacterium]
MSNNTNNSALLLVDIQRGMTGRLTAVYKEEELLKNIDSLIKAAKEAEQLIVNVRHYNRILEASLLGNKKSNPGTITKDGELIVYKENISAFKDTMLKQELDKRGITRIIVAGTVTQGCIKATCLDGKSLGYEVVLVEDGHSNYNQNAEEVIRQWNESLKKENISVLKTSEISFACEHEMMETKLR